MDTLPHLALETLQLVGEVYESAVDIQKRHQVLAHLMQYVDAVFVRVMTLDVMTGALLLTNACGDLVGALNPAELKQWNAVDPLALAVAGLSSGQVRRCHLLFDEHRVQSDPFYTDFCSPRDLRWSMAGTFQDAAGTVTVIALSRGAGQAPFGDGDELAFSQLLPHFARAASMRHQVERQAALALSAANAWKALPMPCFLTDRAGRCVDANDVFHAALEPLALRLTMGRARFAPVLQGAWEAALFQAEVTALPQALSYSTLAGKAWTVHLLPWVGTASNTPHETESTPRLMLALFEEGLKPQAAPVPGLSAIPEAAGLTRAEAEVMSGLLKGWPAKVIASHRSASVNTVRSQIVAILEKTGFKTQKELMACFSNSVSQDPVSSGFSSSLMRVPQPEAIAPKHPRG